MRSTDQGATDWHKSSYSDAERDCIEQGVTPTGSVAVRDTKMRKTGPVLQFSKDQWAQFVASVSA